MAARKAKAAGRKGRAKLLTRRELTVELRGERPSLHPQTIVRWESMGLPVAKPGGPGRPSLYDPQKVRDWLAERDAAGRERGALDPNQERARKDRWMARRSRQEYLVRKRLLLPRDEVEREVGTRVAASRAIMLAWPTAWADRLARVATLEGTAGVERELRSMVREALGELATLRGAPGPSGGPESAPAKRRAAPPGPASGAEATA